MLLSFLLQVATSKDPLFTNDIIGFVKILSVLFVSILLPLAALVVYFLKRGPDMQLAALRTDMNGLGGRVGAVETGLATTNERVNGVYSAIAESQRDIMGAITASGKAQTDATHELALEVARLQERSDIGHNIAEGMVKFGASIDRLAEAVLRPRAD